MQMYAETAPSSLPKSQIAQEDILRSDLYAFLGALLAAPPTQAQLTQICGLVGEDTDIGQGITALARLAASRNAAAVRREYDALFIGLARGELLPYASYYLTGFLHEKPLARLRADLAQHGIARNPDVKEPEDHIATLCEVMAGSIRGIYGPSVMSLEDQAAFFAAHLEPWAGHFFTDLEAAKGSDFYAPVGKIGRAFMKVETEAFRLG